MTANSNHSSFVTANDPSPKVSFESHIADPTSQFSSSHHQYHQQHKRSLIKTDGNQNDNCNNDYRRISILKKHNRDINYDEELHPENHHKVPSRSSSYSEGLESSHTVINNSSKLSFGSKNDERLVVNEKSNTEYYPSHVVRLPQVAAPPPELKTYPIAWVLLSFVVLLRAATAIFSNTFNPIPSITAEFLGVSLSSINWLYNAMSIVYIISCFFTSWLYDFLGVKWSLVLSGVILSLGCWIRWIAVKISPPSFPILMIGQVIASISSPISLNIMTIFARLWFTENRRATAGMFIVSNYGAIIAMFLMPAVATGLDKIEFSAILVACIASACTIPFVFFPKKPRTPTSYDNIEERDEEKLMIPKITLRRGAILLLKNPHFLTLSIVHGLNIGISNSWGALMNQAITPYGYSDNQVGNIAAIGVVGGTLGCLISGPVLDKTKQHKVLLKIMTPLMFSTYVAFIFIIKSESFAAILYTYFINQFFLSFMVPICIELGVEVSYPVPESLSTSILWQVSQVISFILVIIMDIFRDPNGFPKNNMYKALVFQAVIAGVCLLFALVFNGPMHRLEAYKKQEEIRKSEVVEPDRNKVVNSIINNSSHQFFDSSDTFQTLSEELCAVAKKLHRKDETAV